MTEKEQRRKELLQQVRTTTDYNIHRDVKPKEKGRFLTRFLVAILIVCFFAVASKQYWVGEGEVIETIQKNLEKIDIKSWDWYNDK